ncbi:MAG: hypothetical protein RBG1_1C00001G0279 [candidate division Zixibacteria bacterium RBG-1]|nr:MAG: hypothetical protein RBG1_1C00001G0279 [candidate division Zixibacteria bacterium RBG-1]
MTPQGFKIAFWFLISFLLLRILLTAWQKVSVLKTGEKFNFLLTRFNLKDEVSWRDVRYSLYVIIDFLVSMFILIWLVEKVL